LPSIAELVLRKTSVEANNLPGRYNHNQEDLEFLEDIQHIQEEDLYTLRLRIKRLTRR
jgi:hypothetical protein